MNQFRDNPYQSPVDEIQIRAELVRGKPPTPGTLLFVMLGPAAFIIVFRWLIHDVELVEFHSPEFWAITWTALGAWGAAVLRIVWYLVVWSWR